MGRVLFVDMDSFYASCEEVRHPELRGKAFIVGTGDEEHKNRGVVETASFMAKKAGIRSAMPVVMAMKIKKDVIYVSSDHDYYDDMSNKVMTLLKGFGYRTEVLSVDEAALDLEQMSYQEAERLAKKIKEEVSGKLGLKCTIGIADGKILAKIVCDSAKPDGLKVVEADKIKAFIAPMDVEKIPGIGPKSAKRLEDAGIKTVRDLAKADPNVPIDIIGSFGGELHNIANGRDDSKIIEVWKVLSVGRERTLTTRTNDMREINKMLDTLADEVMTDVHNKQLSYKTITVMGRYSDFTNRNKSRSFPNYSDSLELLKETARVLIKELVDDERPFRKVGVRVSSFVEGKGQKKLF